jgi:hypothetical protein
VFSAYLEELDVPFGDVVPLREIEESRKEMTRIIGEIKKSSVKINKESPARPTGQNYFLKFS